jgi:hypothetical protein
VCLFLKLYNNSRTSDELEKLQGYLYVIIPYLFPRSLPSLLKKKDAKTPHCHLGRWSSLYDKITQATGIQNHENENVRNIGQGEARHRKYKRLKLGGGQAYDRSSD